MRADKCRLCERTAELQLSHILPAFVVRWLKRTSIGPLRSGAEPNVRTQDGPKVHLLCRDCEQMFEKWETPFAEQIFTVLHRPDDQLPDKLPYKEWALRFAVSVSWRALAVFTAHERFPQILVSDHQLLRKALSTWSQFLRGERQNPAEFEHHLLSFTGVGRTSHDVSSFLNRYILRSVDLDLAEADGAYIVFTKLGRIFLFGLIPRRPTASGWSNVTKLRLRKGEIALRGAINVPQAVLEFINDRAEKGRAEIASMSPAQKQKVKDGVLKLTRSNPDAEVFRAWLLDHELTYHQDDTDDADGRDA
jgi:hypothetical protein